MAFWAIHFIMIIHTGIVVQPTVSTSCSSTIPNGGTTCPEIASSGRKCGYFCNSGYTWSMGIYFITCQRNGSWNYNPHSLCTNTQQCPYEIPNGDLVISCRRNPGDVCAFTCRPGSYPSETMQITCTSNKTWNRQLSSLCVEHFKLCPSFILNGSVASGCSRFPYTTCQFYCDGHCFPTRVMLNCTVLGTWDFGDTACSCLGRAADGSVSDTSTVALGAGIGGILVVIIIAILVIVLIRRFSWKTTRRATRRSMYHQNNTEQNSRNPGRTLGEYSQSQSYHRPNWYAQPNYRAMFNGRITRQPSATSERLTSTAPPPGGTQQTPLRRHSGQLTQTPSRTSLPSYEDVAAHPSQFHAITWI